jgi:hypothetical protein
MIGCGYKMMVYSYLGECVQPDDSALAIKSIQQVSAMTGRAMWNVLEIAGFQRLDELFLIVGPGGRSLGVTRAL